VVNPRSCYSNLIGYRRCMALKYLARVLLRRRHSIWLEFSLFFSVFGYFTENINGFSEIVNKKHIWYIPSYVRACMPHLYTKLSPTEWGSCWRQKTYVHKSNFARDYDVQRYLQCDRKHMPIENTCLDHTCTGPEVVSAEKQSPPLSLLRAHCSRFSNYYWCLIKS
jgi:hypothetical protein